jgi:hypothetical protein
LQLTKKAEEVMKPTLYCHMMYKSSKEKKLTVRMDLVRHAQQIGIKPTARKFNCSKNTVRRALRGFEKKGISGLEDGRKGPHYIPHKTCPALEEHIVNCRLRAPCFGPKRLRWAFNIEASESAIARIIKIRQLTRKRRKKYQRKQDLRALKAQMHSAFSCAQLDVKHLYDIPYYWEQLVNKGFLPKYQYTIRDVKTGFLFLGYAKEYNEEYSTIMVSKYLDHLRRFGIDGSNITIQTDNGSEFGARKRNVLTPGFINTIICQYSANHVYIPPGMCNANADVESIHSTIEPEFFDIERFHDRDNFWQKINAYQLFYNLLRPNYSKAGRNPLQIILEDRPNIDTRVAVHPVIDLDYEFRMKDNHRKTEKTYGGQSLQKLPVLFCIYKNIIILKTPVCLLGLYFFLCIRTCELRLRILRKKNHKL